MLTTDDAPPSIGVFLASGAGAGAAAALITNPMVTTRGLSRIAAAIV